MGGYHSYLFWVIKIASLLIFGLYPFQFILNIPIRVIFLKYNLYISYHLKLLVATYKSAKENLCSLLWGSWQRTVQLH